MVKEKKKDKIVDNKVKENLEDNIMAKENLENTKIDHQEEKVKITIDQKSYGQRSGL